MYQQSKRVDVFPIAALLIFIVIGFSIIVDSGEGSSGPDENASLTPQPSESNTGGQDPTIPNPRPTVETLQFAADQETLAAPYDEYILTQGQHGFSYGHAAIDISGGKGAVIKSPINGVVSENYIDQYGNTTLIIDNDQYKVTFLHGNYIVNPGDRVSIGQQIGTEGNNGYTMDMQGNLCTNRDCGYHSHLNVFDKQLGDNINPLDFFNLQPATQLRSR